VATLCSHHRAKLHDIFHRGNPLFTPPPVLPIHDGCLQPAAELVLSSQLRRGVWHVLVQWHGMALNDATWEQLPNFKEVYPNVQLKDELFAEVGERSCGARHSTAEQRWQAQQIRKVARLAPN